jgi:hypothetical protein
MGLIAYTPTGTKGLNQICSYANFFSIFILVGFENLKNVITNLLKSIEYILMGLTMFSWPPLIKISGSATAP